jgi:DNA-directed RNA polymerase subunit RPC12/RpoP
MAGVQIKFRCFNCNQLLGVSRSKAGTEVSCPKCSSALLVPTPDDLPVSSGAPEPQPPDTTPAFLSALAAGLPVDIADLRPEDVRVEADDDWSPPISVSAPPMFAPVPERSPSLSSGTTPPVPSPARPLPYDVVPPPARTPAPATMLIPTPGPSPAQAPADHEPIVAAINLAPPSLAGDRTTASRSRDLVLPRSVVAFWSLFVLLAQALAFVAGLLAGHYLWRIH